jgi:MFS family permease
VLATTVLSFGGYALLLPVVPLYAASGGAGPGAAGATTALFMAATVASQLTVPAVLRRAGPRAAVMAGSLALGLPAALLPLSAALPLLLAVAVVRGVGFGLLTVTGAALVADLVPVARRGRATGLYGLAVGLPQLVLLSGGVSGYVVLGATPVLLLGAALPLLAVPVARLVPARTTPTTSPATSSTTGSALRLGWGALAPWAAMVVAAAAAGGVLTVLPLWAADAPGERPGLAGGTTTAAVALFALTAGQLLGRSLAGELADRRGARRPGARTAVGLGVAAAGGVVIALAGVGAVVVLGATLVGLGFGAVQSDTLLALFARAGPTRSGPASTWWNTGYDSGTGLGAAALGALLGAAGGPAAFLVAAVACVVVLPSALVVRPGRRTSTERNHQ